MTPVLTHDTLTVYANFREIAALWTHDERVFLNAWQPVVLECYLDRFVRLPGDVLLASHLDFHDAGGRTWVETVSWAYPPFPQCLDVARMAEWNAAIARHQFTWSSSLCHPRFDAVHTHFPALLR